MSSFGLKFKWKIYCTFVFAQANLNKLFGIKIIIKSIFAIVVSIHKFIDLTYNVRVFFAWVFSFHYRISNKISFNYICDLTYVSSPQRPCPLVVGDKFHWPCETIHQLFPKLFVKFYSIGIVITNKFSHPRTFFEG